MSSVWAGRDSDGIQSVYMEHNHPAPQAAWPSESGQKDLNNNSAMLTSATSNMNSVPAPTICGISRRAFIITVLVAAAIIIAGALAGGLAGGLLSQNRDTDSSTSPVATTTINALTSSASSSEATATETDDSSDCPDSDGTDYTSVKFSSGSNGDVPEGAKKGLKFTKRCGAGSTGTNIMQGTFADFNKCLDLCASYNFWNNSTNCTLAAYCPNRGGGECWAKNGAVASGGEDENCHVGFLVDDT